ncbi:Receptor-like serine/threonine-protein kinase [Heracleum sosnowskyi]|uniref:Receptor-like serine/threonine-protein kinase n=1 Tax=Heracleum sosnowskyi TaxID=360622 RepID=A0AAD8I093_9APIA|nr:Receptor-like serine/threonine-protein kinase [Heracleum sosnowskyi]
MVPARKSDSFKLLMLMFLYTFNSLKTTLGLDEISSGKTGNGNQTFRSGQPLFGDERLVSKGGQFEMGFFSPGGNLILFDGLNKRIWAVNNSVGLSSVPNKGVLLDDGNFVLSDGLSIIWQSFDYPTDTWLPRGKLGLDESLINQRQLLTSWKNPDDPAPGKYSFGMNSRGSPEFFMWTNQTQILWRSQVWNGNDFAFFPNLLTNFSYIINGQAKYFTYNTSALTTTRYVMTYNGQINQLVWSETLQQWEVIFSQPADSCNSFSVCGPNGFCNITSSPACGCYNGFQPRSQDEWQSADWSGGCIRTKPLRCSNIGFNTMSGVSMPANSQSLDLESDQVCRFACLGNCSCTAYAYNGGRCSLWTGDLLDTRALVDSQGDLYVKSPDVILAREKKKSSVLVALFITIPLFVCISLIYLLWRIWRSKHNKEEADERNENLLFLNLEISSKQNTASDTITTESTLRGEKKVVNLPQFSFSSISAATDNFSPANKLGEGGFGPVYRGNLFDGHSVAVKRLSTRSGQGLEELKNETVLISKLQHRNLVRLLGCCIEQGEKILIYEYMQNKSLDLFIFDPSKKYLLDWRTRVRIIEGISQGLLYLHQHSRLRIIHRDLKASNVLLDDEMNPKISDFGLARIFGGDELQANTNRIVGTYGYMSPEYAMEGLFSIKSDVFAFGVLLLEILSGKKSTGFRNSDCLSLLGYAWELWISDRVLELIDSNLELPSSFLPLRFIHVGLLCVQESPADRPTMSEVLAMFSNEHMQLVFPKRPAFTSGGSLGLGIVSTENYSINTFTTSVMDGR